MNRNSFTLYLYASKYIDGLIIVIYCPWVFITCYLQITLLHLVTHMKMYSCFSSTVYRFHPLFIVLKSPVRKNTISKYKLYENTIESKLFLIKGLKTYYSFTVLYYCLRYDCLSSCTVIPVIISF